MTSPNIYEIVNTWATALSALAAFFGVLAAIRSAKSAQDAARISEEAERRANLREISYHSSGVIHECIALKSIAKEFKYECNVANDFTRGEAQSEVQALEEAIDKSLNLIEEISIDAQLFDRGTKNFETASSQELDSILIKMKDHLLSAITLRDDLLRKHSNMLAMNALKRSKRISQ